MLPIPLSNGPNGDKILELRYSFGLGGGNSRAVTGSLKPVLACEPSQNGLLADCPQRHSEITVRPASPKAAPDGSRISNSPSIRIGPLFKTVTLVGIKGIVTRPFESRFWRRKRNQREGGRPYFFLAGGGTGGVVGGPPVLPSSTTSPNLMVERPSYFL